MSEQPDNKPHQKFSISDDASVEGSQIAGQAGRDSTVAQNQGSGNIFQDVTFNVFGRQAKTKESGLTRQEYRHRQALLNKVKNYWIKGVLEKSLHYQRLIELGLEVQPDAVTFPWKVDLETDDKAPEPLSQGTQVLSIFDDLGEGRTLLILGEPGAGKTITLLQLTRNLIDRAEQDISHPIPVVFNLSSWLGEKQSIEDWLIEELNTKYHVSKRVAQAWINAEQLLLMLDGLDEVRAEDREACVTVLNTFHREYNSEIVVCSRLKDYKALSKRLNFQKAICLKSLLPQQVRHYLESESSNLKGLQTLVDADSALQELVKSPLMLNIMVLAYQGSSVDDLPKTNLVSEHRNHLFDTYINKMLKHRVSSHQYTKEQTIRWLNWLAQMMAEKAQTVFLIERIQPTWISTKRQRILYRIGLGLLVGFSCGLSFGLLSQLSLGLIAHGLTTKLIPYLSTGLIIAITIGSMLALATVFLRGDIRTVETLKWSWIEALKGSIFWIIIGFTIGLIGGLIVDVINSLISGVVLGQSNEPWLAQLKMRIRPFDGVLGLIAGLIYGLTNGIGGSEIETKTIPNQAIWRSAISARIFGLIGGITGGLIGGLASGLMEDVLFSDGLISGLTVGLVFGLIGGGGIACAKHFTLRLILYRQGFIPWNYARFLNYATEIVFLQKVGGSYIFIHRLLLEHFARIKLP